MYDVTESRAADYQLVVEWIAHRLQLCSALQQNGHVCFYFLYLAFLYSDGLNPCDILFQGMRECWDVCVLALL
jgi:hypothetical protein